MKLHVKRIATCAIAFIALASFVPIIGNAKQGPEPAVFRVGAAAVDVTPTTPLYIGGYGKQTLVSESHDPLEVRAFVVAKGDKAVAFVIVDSTGWFAEYQGAEAGLGEKCRCAVYKPRAAARAAHRTIKVERLAKPRADWVFMRKL